QVTPRHEQLAAIGTLCCEHEPQERRLARTRRTREQHRIALSDGERDPAQRRRAGERLPNPVELDHCSARSLIRRSPSSTANTARLAPQKIGNVLVSVVYRTTIYCCCNIWQLRYK